MQEHTQHSMNNKLYIAVLEYIEVLGRVATDSHNLRPLLLKLLLMLPELCSLYCAARCTSLNEGKCFLLILLA